MVPQLGFERDFELMGLRRRTFRSNTEFFFLKGGGSHHGTEGQLGFLLFAQTGIEESQPLRSPAKIVAQLLDFNWFLQLVGTFLSEF